MERSTTVPTPIKQLRRPTRPRLRRAENREKAEVIRAWVDPEERITVDFDDASGLNAEVIACTDHVVKLGLETPFPHYRQRVVVPLGRVTVSEDPSRYTRNPNRPIRYGRLWLIINKKRPTGL